MPSGSASWLMGRDPQAASDAPEQQCRCCRRRCRSIVTYLTAQVQDGQLAFVDDIYGRDTQRWRSSRRWPIKPRREASAEA